MIKRKKKALYPPLWIVKRHLVRGWKWCDNCHKFSSLKADRTMKCCGRVSFQEGTCPRCGLEKIDIYERYYMHKESFRYKIPGVFELKDDGTWDIRYNRHFKKTLYPIYGKADFNMAVAISSGGNPIDCAETHYCPVCRKEFVLYECNY